MYTYVNICSVSDKLRVRKPNIVVQIPLPSLFLSISNVLNQDGAFSCTRISSTYRRYIQVSPPPDSHKTYIGILNTCLNSE